MQATVRFKDGTTKVCRIVGIENDGSGDYGYAVQGTWYVPISQSTTYRDSQGQIVRKDWDEIVGSDWLDKEEYKQYHTYQPRW